MLVLIVDPGPAQRFSPDTTTFRTGSFAGFVNLKTAVLPGVDEAASANVAMFAWDTSGGSYTDPAAAWAAFRDGRTLGGISPTITVFLFGTGPPSILTGLQSFNIYSVPEPSALSLAVLGAVSLLLRSRRK